MSNPNPQLPPPAPMGHKRASKGKAARNISLQKIRVNEKESAIIALGAQASGKPMATWMRETLLKEAARLSSEESGNVATQEIKS